MTNKALLQWERTGSSFAFSVSKGSQALVAEEWCKYKIEHEGGHANVTSLFRGLDMGLVKEVGNQLVCTDHYIASLTEVEVLNLALPKPSQCRLKIKSSGLITHPSFSLDYKLLRPDGRPYMGIKRDGVVLSAGGEQFLVLDPIYTLIEKIDHYRSAPATDRDERFVRWGKIQALLPSDSIVDGILESISICRADRFTLDIKPNGRFEPILIKPRIDKEIDVQGQSDIEYAIPAVKQREFEKQFSNRHMARSNYAIGNNTYVVMPERVVKALAVVRNYQQKDKDARLAFVANPEQYISDQLQDTWDTEEELSSLFVETPEFISQRIECIGVWEPKICAYVAQRNGDWLPEDDQRVYIPLGDILVQLSVDGARKLLKLINDALDNNASQVTFEEQNIDATLENKNYLIRFLRPFEELIEEKPTGSVLAPIVSGNIEDVEFNLIAGEQRPTLNRIPKALKTTPLYPHQDIGVNWLARHWETGSMGALLADDMGLGKTLQALSFLASLRESMQTGNYPTKPILVVAPSGLLRNWIDEEKIHFHRPGLGALFEAYGPSLRTFSKRSMLERNTIIAQSAWVMTTYETLRDKIKYFISIDWAVVIFDEAQKIKNPDSRNTEMAKSLSSDFTVVMTGTPVENELKDLWCLIDTVQPGLFGSLREFHNKYVVPSESNPMEARKLKDILVEGSNPPLMLRRMKEEHLKGLPQKHSHEIKINMPKHQADAYEGIIKDGQLLKGTAGGMLKIIQQMRRASLIAEDLDETGITDGIVHRSARLSGLIQLLDTINEEKQKALIFVEQLDIQEHLATYLQARYQLPKRPMIINGKIDGATRKKYVDIFQTSKEEDFNVMLLSPKAGGVGLTITAANHVIHLSRWWNPAVEDQSTDRVFRIGQKNDVHVYYPIAIHPIYKQKSFDANLNRLLSEKRDLSKNALISGSFTNNDFIELLEESINQN